MALPKCTSATTDTTRVVFMLHAVLCLWPIVRRSAPLPRRFCRINACSETHIGIELRLMSDSASARPEPGSTAIPAPMDGRQLCLNFCATPMNACFDQFACLPPTPRSHQLSPGHAQPPDRISLDFPLLYKDRSPTDPSRSLPSRCRSSEYSPQICTNRLFTPQSHLSLPEGQVADIATALFPNTELLNADHNKDTIGPGTTMSGIAAHEMKFVETLALLNNLHPYQLVLAIIASPGQLADLVHNLDHNYRALLCLLS